MRATDERDLVLAEHLDRAARPFPEATDVAVVLRRGTRRRAARVVAAGASVAVFVAAVGWGAILMRRGGSVLGSLGDEGWTMTLPEGWHAQTIAGCEGVEGGIGDGIVATNIAFTFRNPEGGDPACGDRFVFAGFPENGVALSIEPAPVGMVLGAGATYPGGTPMPLDDRQFLGTDQIVGGPAMSLAPLSIGGRQVGDVRRWIGPAASPETVAELDATVASIDVEGAAHWTDIAIDSGPIGELRLSIPDDWRVASDPGTSPLLLSPGASTDAGNCTWGDNAGELGGGAALLIAPYPDPPQPPELGTLSWVNADSLERDARCGTETITRAMWRFTLDGRALSAWLAVEGSDDSVARIAWTIVEGMTFGKPARTYTVNGSMTTLIDLGDLFSVTYPTDGFLPSDVPVNTWVASPREILALATYPLRPGGHAVTDGQVPSNAMDDLGPDDAFIWVNEAGDGRTMPPRPDRIEALTICGDGEICDEPTGRVLGIPDVRAWWLYFQDAGRGIYVFVAMGEDAFQDPARAQEIWDVVDSLVFQPR